MIAAFSLLEKAFVDLKIEYNQELLLKFESYMQLILEWNEKINLTSITDEKDFIIKHFIDSLLCTAHPAVSRAKKIIDIGTGAGFPGIPLALIYPDIEFVLMDSINKKLIVLKEITKKLGLPNVFIVHARAEDLGHQKQHRESYDICVSRAVAKLQVLSEYCLPFVRREGYFIAYKGSDINQEVADSQRAIEVLGGQIEAISPFTLNDMEIGHQLIYIKKEKDTPEKYPRKAGIPQKEPI
jgi:16S rRNA (guanine527-N7)-methyltransferase